MYKEMGVYKGLMDHRKYCLFEFVSVYAHNLTLPCEARSLSCAGFRLSTWCFSSGFQVYRVPVEMIAARTKE